MAPNNSDEPSTGNVVPIGSKGPASGIPARGYSWEPFKPNHTKSLKHGAYSERVITPMVAEIANELLRRHEWLRADEHHEAVQAYARVAARVETLERWVADHGVLNDEGEPTGAANHLLRESKHLGNLADRLGLSPLSRARLGKDLTAANANVDIAKAIAEALAQGQEKNA